MAPPPELSEKLAALDSQVKSNDSDVDVVGEKGYASEKSSQLETATEDGDSVKYVNGEPVITTGRDVSRFLVDVRDDGDPALTFRSFVLGTVFAGLGASLVQVRHFTFLTASAVLLNTIQIYLFKPVQMSISTVFLLLIIYSFGILWAAVLPKPSLVEGTRWAHLAPIIRFINPGPFGLKEVRGP